MTRDRYGAWGAGLDEAEFARALAAAGVAAALAGAGGRDATPRVRRDADGDEPLPWRDPASAPGWDPVAGPDGREWAQAWNRYAGRTPPRLALRLSSSDVDAMAISATLRRVAVPFVPLLPDGPASSWRFPIRVGALDDRPGRALLADLRRSAARPGDAVEPVAIGRERIACDILVLPCRGPDALGAVRRLRAVRAGTVLVRNAAGAWDEEWIAALAEITGAWAIGIQQPAPTAARVAGLCDDLSGDRSFAEAFWSGPGGVLAARGDAIGPHSVARLAFATARRLRLIAETADVDEADLGEAAGTGDLASAFLRIATGGSLEIGDGRPLGEHTEGRTGDLLELERRAAPVFRASAAERRLQARIAETGRPEVVLTRFRRDARHRIEVRIGPHQAGWLGAPDPFPAEQAAGPRQIVVLLTEPDLLPEPLRGEVTLPVAGASTVVTFHLSTRPDTEYVDARLLAYSGNRLLQTARLPAGVGDDPASAPGPARTARPEVLVGAATDDLADRRPFDAAVFVGSGGHGEAQMTAMAGVETATLRFADGAVTDAMTVIRTRLAELVADDQQAAGLDDPAAVELLIFLAFHGILLRQALERDAAGLTAALRDSRYLQIVSAKPDEFLPLEFAYDFPLPAESAELCPQALAALASPDPDATCTGAHTADVVCPLGFWGLSKIVERHAFRPEEPVAGSFLLRGGPVRDRDRIPLGPALMAASDRVDRFAEGSVRRLFGALQRSWALSRQVDGWADWPKAVADCRPALIMLLPHTVHSSLFGGYGLEIGANARLWSAAIDSTFVPPGDRPVIVVLLGCETAAAGSIGYEMFPALLRGAGAEIVLATFTEILGRHAAPVGAALAAELHRFCRDEPHGLGEVMLRLRRRLLADGVLTVLTLAAFGDADWLISAGES